MGPCRRSAWCRGGLCLPMKNLRILSTRTCWRWRSGFPPRNTPGCWTVTAVCCKAPVRVSLDAAGAGLSATGRISRASGAAGDGQTGRLVYASLNAAPGFKPEDFVTVHVTEPEVRAVARVPASALGADGSVLLLGDQMTGWKRCRWSWCAARAMTC